MRIVDRKTFLTLPVGTAYCKGREPPTWIFEGICFKGEPMDDGVDDWREIDHAWVDADDSNQAFDRLDEMLATGRSYPMQDSQCRDGLFDQNIVFIIFDIEDLYSWLDDIYYAILAATRIFAGGQLDTKK